MHHCRDDGLGGKFGLQLDAFGVDLVGGVQACSQIVTGLLDGLPVQDSVRCGESVAVVAAEAAGFACDQVAVGGGLVAAGDHGAVVGLDAVAHESIADHPDHGRQRFPRRLENAADEDDPANAQASQDHCVHNSCHVLPAFRRVTTRGKSHGSRSPEDEYGNSGSWCCYSEAVGF